MPSEIENLVFEGGGTKGSAYAGCIEMMETLHMYESVKRVAGTSAGSITATLLACGSGSAGLTKAVNHTDFRKFIHDSWGLIGDITRTFSRYGMHTGKELVTTLKEYIQNLTGNGDITFSQLQEKAHSSPEKYKQLSVVASNLTRQCPQIFNAKESPELQVWKAVRASVSIPMIFEPTLINGDYFVDGSLAWIYPVNIYDQSKTDKSNGEEVHIRNPKTLGFYLESQSIFPSGKKFNAPTFKIDSLEYFGLSMASFMLERANHGSMHPEDKSRTVFINDLGVSSTSFDTSEKKINALIQSGRKATENFFHKS